MIAETADYSILQLLKSKLTAYADFAKMRLTILVVLSSILGYAIGVETFSWIGAAWLSLGGFLVTGASNGFNQIIERDIDALMNRTENRPLPTGRMSVTEGMLLATLMAISGLLILLINFNTLAAVLGGLALFSYVLLYTPLKKHSSWAVFVGAFPGALPPMLGYVAATGHFDMYAGLLFAVQFVWQFPHFWAIAWVADSDYKRAGYRLLPSKAGKDSRSAFLTLLYTLFLIPVAMLPWAYGLIDFVAATLAAIFGVLFALPAFNLFFKKTDKAARQVMFASFFYLPLVLLVYLLG